MQRLINRVRCLIYFPRLILRSKLTPADQIRKIKVNNDPAEALFGSVAGEQEYDRKISNTKQRWNNTPQLPLNNIYIYIYIYIFFFFFFFFFTLSIMKKTLYAAPRAVTMAWK